jgi:phage-related protein
MYNSVDNMVKTPYNIITENTLEEFMTNFKAEFYEKNGNKPAKDFILSLEPKMKAKMFHLVDMLENYGNELREPYSKHLGDGIFELRCKLGTDITRVLYFFYYEGRIILTNGFTKKTQKTPQREIKIAKESRIDFIERNGK